LGQVKISTDAGIFKPIIKKSKALKFVSELNEDNDRYDENEPFVKITLYSSKQVKRLFGFF